MQTVQDSERKISGREDHVEIVENPKEDFGDLTNLFSWELRGEGINQIVEQMTALHQLISDHARLNERYKNDPDTNGDPELATYVNEAEYAVQTALENFRINDKQLDIRTLCYSYDDEELDYEVMYNEIVSNTNDARVQLIREGKTVPNFESF